MNTKLICWNIGKGDQSVRVNIHTTQLDDTKQICWNIGKGDERVWVNIHTTQMEDTCVQYRIKCNFLFLRTIFVLM